MDVLAYLEENLKNKNWSLDEKCRYLYLQSCLLFSYDPRRKWLMYEPNEALTKEIWDRQINLNNVTDFNVICTSWYKEVYLKLIHKLLGIRGNSEGTIHKYVSLKNQKGERILADATLGNDLARVKMGLSTKSYKKENETIKESQIWLKPQDQKIGYIKEFYFEETFSKIKQELLEKTKDLEAIDKYIVYLSKIIKLYNTFTFQNYNDARYCFYYLCDKLLEDITWDCQEIELYQDFKDKSWDFVSIYPINLPKGILYFKLFLGSLSYNIEEIEESEVHYLKKNLKS